jgi:hypothetical protein
MNAKTTPTRTSAWRIKISLEISAYNALMIKKHALEEFQIILAIGFQLCIPYSEMTLSRSSISFELDRNRTSRTSPQHANTSQLGAISSDRSIVEDQVSSPIFIPSTVAPRLGGCCVQLLYLKLCYGVSIKLLHIFIAFLSPGPILIAKHVME